MNCNCKDDCFLVKELEQKLEQTEKDLADYQFNYPTIKELQKENAELKKTYRKQRNKRIDELQKENAELKSEKGCETCTKFDEVQLTKAKEIIENLLGVLPDEVLHHDYYKRKYVDPAEQFLKDSEVEK